MSDQTSNPIFPDVEQALTEPDGLLAVGGDLSPERLLYAYRHGIFPWYSEDQPILWWSPNPRSILFPDKIKLSRSLSKTLKKNTYQVTMDTCFKEVMHACAQPRKDGHGTWITDEMIQAYCSLHDMGYAHSIESWYEGKLVGGLYGVAIGKAFFGESMFCRKSDASKVAFVKLVEQLQKWRFGIIDCQMQTPYLDSFGAENIPRKEFISILTKLCPQAATPSPWKFEESK